MRARLLCRVDPFRSAPPHGGRRSCAGEDRLKDYVSIRAPARGATRANARLRRWLSSFDPRPRTGGDAARNVHAANRICFDPRPRTGGDMEFPRLTCATCCFDPRPRTGGDRARRAHNQSRRLFRSAPPHGGRLAPATCWAMHPAFRSAPPHGGRRRHGPLPGFLPWFRSAPPHGGRPNAALRHPCGCCFDPRPRTGGDPH